MTIQSSSPRTKPESLRCIILGEATKRIVQGDDLVRRRAGWAGDLTIRLDVDTT
jgi:hypothetical protein